MASIHAKDPEAGLPTLSAEIWDHVCSHMSKPTLLQLRLVSRQLSGISLRWAYRSLRLEAFGTSAERLANIARTPRLRDHVRELTIDTWIGPDFAYHANMSYDIPQAFIDSLPYLSCFGRLKALHLRFSEYCGENDRSGMDVEETWDFRYKMLDTICHCVAGTWSREHQEEVDDEVAITERRHPDPDEAPIPSGQAIHLRELTIANLADYHEPRLSEALEKVFTLSGLVDLKLFVTAEVDEASPESAKYFAEKYEFFDKLPLSWLSPTVAGNLQVLSLYYRDYWGWFPKMDFRSIGQGSPFPRLKVLALGNYVFSHEWQVDWFASLGKDNRVSGIEELYLEDCPVLFKAEQTGPFSSSDPGYPVAETVLGAGWNPVTRDYPMRWHYILPRWTESMKALRVFRMGHGCWMGAPEDTITAIERDGSYDNVDPEVQRYRASDQLHRSFACPAPINIYADEDPEPAYKAGRHLHGTGMSESRICQMQYIEYNIGSSYSPWIEPRDFDGRYSNDAPFEPEEGTAAKDDAAFGALMAAVEARVGA